MNEDALRELRATIARLERGVEQDEEQQVAAQLRANGYAEEAATKRAAIEGLRALLPTEAAQ